MPASLLIDTQALLFAVALITPRVWVCLVILPGFGTNSLTGIARNAIAFAIAVPAIIPTFDFVRESQPDMLVTVILALKEAGIGMILGIMLAIPAWTAQSLGSVIDTIRSPMQIQDPNSWTEASALGGMLLQAMMMVMIQAGLLVAMTRILIESFALWPAYSMTPPYELGHLDVLIKRFSEFFWHLVVYGAPVIIPLVLIDFAFAVIGVFASNLQVSFMTSPIKARTGLFILMVYWPTLSHYVAGDFSGVLQFLPSLFQAGPGS